MKRILASFTTSVTLAATSLAIFPLKSGAQISACPASGTQPSLSASCAGTPDRYEIVIYEMGLCTADPLASGSFNASTCTATLISSGTTVDLAGGASFNLGGSGSGMRPTDGTYSHAYIIISNAFGLRGSYALTAGSGFAGTYASTSSGGAALGGTATNFTETLTNFGGGPACVATASENVGSGQLNAALADSSLTTATSCTGVTRIVGSFAPSSPLLITPSTTGIQVTFSVTNNGMTVMDNGSGSSPVVGFGSGPFSPTFTILN